MFLFKKYRVFPIYSTPALDKILSMKAGQARFIRRKIDLGAGLPKQAQQVAPDSHSTREGDVMKCHRCNGMMVFEKFYGDCEYFLGWRCITCGEIVDQVILENRLQSI